MNWERLDEKNEDGDTLYVSDCVTAFLFIILVLTLITVTAALFKGSLPLMVGVSLYFVCGLGLWLIDWFPKYVKKKANVIRNKRERDDQDLIEQEIQQLYGKIGFMIMQNNNMSEQDRRVFTREAGLINQKEDRLECRKCMKRCLERLKSDYPHAD